MAIKVKIENFQSIEKADLEINGFTVITGKNNSGKSAVLRAIRGVFQNTGGNAFVRYGKPHSSVSLDFEDGNSVTWLKGKKENKYLINGKEYDKVGSGVPEPLQDFLMQPIKAGGREIWSQFAPQFTGQVFLLNETGSVLAESISDVERVQTLNNALKKSEKDKRSASSTLKVRKTDEKEVGQSLLAYEGLDEVGLLLDTIESLEQKIDKLTRAIEKLSSYLSQRTALVSLVLSLRGVTAITAPDTAKVEETCVKLASLRGLQVRYAHAQCSETLLQGVSDITVPPTGTIEDISREILELSVLETKRERAIKGSRLMASMCSSLSDHLVPLDKTSFLAETGQALEQLRGFQMTQDTNLELIEELENNILEHKEAQVSLQQHLRKHAHSLGGCPLCGSEVC